MINVINVLAKFDQLQVTQGIYYYEINPDRVKQDLNIRLINSNTLLLHAFVKYSLLLIPIGQFQHRIFVVNICITLFISLMSSHVLSWIIDSASHR